ncbi:uncharacterized protein CIMG_05564 [Coccidioides immitis RS]|uniref:Uncharacterized protein n=3 Tax=Coccidioides immitis TaxID=5501 RepID=J3KFV3_COCIM|nr:uncharacterized protein CIMG_05564 [Coccidioides immitis RS]EAS34540.3 hypothetical protein CIMG_05564 [Coccidioides immitis RS]KMU74433.1 hypothetical protein CISG_04504 [Coccidioides immitis RMSCC 3703]KMU86931.1 hypothetical protein CIHG_04870 [Coccidioides immitis H538.4]
MGRVRPGYNSLSSLYWLRVPRWTRLTSGTKQQLLRISTSRIAQFAQQSKLSRRSRANTDTAVAVVQYSVKKTDAYTQCQRECRAARKGRILDVQATENDATGSDKRSQQRPWNPGGRTRRRLDMYAVGPDLVWTVAEGHWV